MPNQATISIHERLDAPGYVVRLVAHQDGKERVGKYICDTFTEAEELATSFRGLLAATGDVDALLPDPEDDQ